MREIKIIEVKSEIGASTRGASLGVDAIKSASLDAMDSFFADHPSETVENENYLLHEEINTPFAKRITGVYKMYERVSSAVLNAVQSGFFPVVLSGDHSTAGATIAGLKMANPARRLGVIWIDAHADLHSPYTTSTSSCNMHGMPLALSLGEDNKNGVARVVDETTIAYWEKLKNIGQINPKINARDLVFIGLRDYEIEEKKIIDDYNIKAISVKNLRDQGVQAIVKALLIYLQDCDDIYISLDVDSLDPSISKGTGTPVKNGLKEREVEDLVASLMQCGKINCFEITEVNPTLDDMNVMGRIAFKILRTATRAAFIYE